MAELSIKKEPTTTLKITYNQQLLIQSALEYRVEYYQKRQKAIEDIRDKLDNYSTLIQEAKRDEQLYQELLDTILAKEAKKAGQQRKKNKGLNPNLDP